MLCGHSLLHLHEAAAISGDREAVPGLNPAIWLGGSGLSLGGMVVLLNGGIWLAYGW
jgi:hypothetical protein